MCPRNAGTLQRLESLPVSPDFMDFGEETAKTQIQSLQDVDVGSQIIPQSAGCRRTRTSGRGATNWDRGDSGG
ncbi:hypothetical protein JZ751_028360 [Albula glossodonta]|uniref:Uncharacterized protein n=1 Tax=Albula glossodonta TaxID=121402 RepID=A0A8T2NEG8_9TELE|nr:hypothetical protein JZ751_028360 [Albula glossodonta]